MQMYNIENTFMKNREIYKRDRRSTDIQLDNNNFLNYFNYDYM